MIATGQTVTVVIGGSDSILDLINNPLGRPLRDRVTEALARQGAKLLIRSYDERTGQPISGLFSNTYTYTASLVAETQIDRANADEVASVLSFAFYLATGYAPNEVGVSAIGRAPTGSIVPGAPPTSAPAQILDNLSGFLSGLSGSLGYILIGLIVVILIVLAWGLGTTGGQKTIRAFA